MLVLSNGLLIWQNIKLRAEIDRHKPNILQKGDKVEAFSAPSLRNQIINVNYTGREPTRIFLFFTASCPYCGEQFPYWKEMLNKTNGNHFQIIGIVSDSEDRTKLEEYLRTQGCDSLPVAILPKEISKNYKLSVTPTTLVNDNEGKVQQVWTGKWTASELAKAGSLFGFRVSQP